MSTRVVLVEDSDVYRATLELLLPREGGIEVVGSFATGAEAVDAVAALRPDVVVVDLRLAGMDGIATTAALRRGRQEVAVVCLTAEATEDERAAVLEAGAVAVVDKGQAVSELADALHDACRPRDRS